MRTDRSFALALSSATRHCWPDGNISLPPAMAGHRPHPAHGVAVLRECRALGMVDWASVRPVGPGRRPCRIPWRPERLDSLADCGDGARVLRDRGNDSRLAIRTRAGGAQRISAGIRRRRAAKWPGWTRGPSRSRSPRSAWQVALRPGSLCEWTTDPTPFESMSSPATIVLPYLLHRRSAASTAGRSTARPRSRIGSTRTRAV